MRKQRHNSLGRLPNSSQSRFQRARGAGGSWLTLPLPRQTQPLGTVQSQALRGCSLAGTGSSWTSARENHISPEGVPSVSPHKLLSCTGHPGREWFLLTQSASSCCLASPDVFREGRQRRLAEDSKAEEPMLGGQPPTGPDAQPRLACACSQMSPGTPALCTSYRPKPHGSPGREVLLPPLPICELPESEMTSTIFNQTVTHHTRSCVALNIPRCLKSCTSKNTLLC